MSERSNTEEAEDVAKLTIRIDAALDRASKGGGGARLQLSQDELKALRNLLSRVEELHSIEIQHVFGTCEGHLKVMEEIREDLRRCEIRPVLVAHSLLPEGRKDREQHIERSVEIVSAYKSWIHGEFPVDPSEHEFRKSLAEIGRPLPPYARLCGELTNIEAVRLLRRLLPSKNLLAARARLERAKSDVMELKLTDDGGWRERNGLLPSSDFEIPSRARLDKIKD